MKPGRELDARIATEVMGWKRMTYQDTNPPPAKYVGDTRLTMHWHSLDGKEMALAEDSHDYYTPEDAWSPSTDIAAAWEVVEKLPVHLTISRGDDGFTVRWTEQRHLFADMPIGKVDGFGEISASRGSRLTSFRSETSDTAAHAICLAALKAIGAA